MFGLTSLVSPPGFRCDPRFSSADHALLGRILPDHQEHVLGLQVTSVSSSTGSTAGPGCDLRDDAQEAELRDDDEADGPSQTRLIRLRPQRCPGGPSAAASPPGPPPRTGAASTKVSL
ncbi:unnamed protein product [Prorocentrum cordatum]|uniref:Uncharacterized protein n=1 Tax=Prorocentrum cordatum TaxID=2364126 RepID=A0ABN9UZP0_9DINO|nr:unnamed protein product [Polarella glacialis]